MKQKSSVSSQLLILAMAALVIIFMIQVAQAQSSTDTIAQSTANQSQISSGISSGGAQVLRIDMPQKNLFRRLLEKTTLSYYQQFLGPTAKGSTSETYNIFQEGMDDPGTGRAPLQSFHAVRLAYQINSDWSVGVSLAADNGYTAEVENEGRFGSITNKPATNFYNARAFVSVPSVKLPFGTLFSTFSYEAPTSTISRNDDMKYGIVISESLSFNSPSPRWSYGLMAQYYRMFFDHESNVKPPPCLGCTPIQLQSVILSGGPYANYRMNDNWQLGSLIVLDWDQRGVQTGSREFNNNLPHRGRMTLSYFPTSLKYLSNVGVFTQALLKFRPETTAFGAEFALKF